MLILLCQALLTTLAVTGGVPGGYSRPGCRTVYETVITTVYEDHCSTSHHQTCSPSYHCQHCSTIYETSYANKCSTTYQKVCSSKHKRSPTILRHLAHKIGKLIKAHKIGKLIGEKKKKCHKVPVQKCHRVPVKTPKQSCRPLQCEKTCRSEPRKSCTQVPVRRADKVAKEVCSG